MTRLTRAAAAIAAALIATPTVAAALPPQTQIDFETLPDGAALPVGAHVTDAFADKGVIFSIIHLGQRQEVGALVSDVLGYDQHNGIWNTTADSPVDAYGTDTLRISFINGATGLRVGGGYGGVYGVSYKVYGLDNRLLKSFGTAGGADMADDTKGSYVGQPIAYVDVKPTYSWDGPLRLETLSFTSLGTVGSGPAGAGSGVGSYSAGKGVTWATNGSGVVFGRFGAAAAMPAVPEASSWAMLVVGFGAIGAAMRRRRVRPMLA